MPTPLRKPGAKPDYGDYDAAGISINWTTTFTFADGSTVRHLSRAPHWFRAMQLALRAVSKGELASLEGPVQPAPTSIVVEQK